MTREIWVEQALENDDLVADFLVRMKHRLSSDSIKPKPHTPFTTITHINQLKLPLWGHRKNRSKPAAPTTNVASGFGKEQRGSPTTHLSWSGGGGSTSSGYDDSSRPSDLSSGGRSVKANDGASTSSYNKSLKRKSFADLKDEEGSLLKERIHINKELESMRVTLNKQMVTSENLKRFKTNMDEKPRKEMKKMKVVKQSCKVEAEKEIKGEERGFVLPDLNMTPNEEDVAMMS